MLWFFERDGVQVHYEVRPAEFCRGFELVIRFPDGQERREVFLTHAAVLHRQRQLDLMFEERGWVEYASLGDDGLPARPRRDVPQAS
jgi:hypothetical protein